MHSEYLTKVDERLPQSGRIVHSPDNVSHFWGYIVVVVVVVVCSTAPLRGGRRSNRSRSSSGGHVQGSGHTLRCECHCTCDLVGWTATVVCPILCSREECLIANATSASKSSDGRLRDVKRSVTNEERRALLDIATLASCLKMDWMYFVHESDVPNGSPRLFCMKRLMHHYCYYLYVQHACMQVQVTRNSQSVVSGRALPLSKTSLSRHTKSMHQLIQYNFGRVGGIELYPVGTSLSWCFVRTEIQERPRMVVLNDQPIGGCIWNRIPCCKILATKRYP